MMEGMASFSVPFRRSFSRYSILLFQGHPYCPVAGGSSRVFTCPSCVPGRRSGHQRTRDGAFILRRRGSVSSGLRYTINMPCGFCLLFHYNPLKTDSRKVSGRGILFF